MVNESINNSFKNIKEDMDSLNNQITSIKSILKKQNEVILALTEKVSEALNSPKLEKSPLFNISTGNERVNQINNHLITPSKQGPGIDDLGQNKAIPSSSTGNERVQAPKMAIKDEKNIIFKPQLEKESQKSVFRMAQDQLNTTFNKISKQELKTFLTIYQLEEEGLETSYRSVAERMDLSEHCIRAHIWSLFKKKAPLYKAKLNNRLTLLYVDKDFKGLKLKERLINIYYQTDPHQKTLFDNYL
jgi:hypothetical protein